MRPHAIAGTPGAEVIDTLDRMPEDYWLPKPKMSAFFQTGLDAWLLPYPLLRVMPSAELLAELA